MAVVADRCVFFEDLVRFPHGRQRTYEVHERPGSGLACIAAHLRAGEDWHFARRWVRTTGGSRELYRWLDRLEAWGFRFRIAAGLPPGPAPGELERARREFGHVVIRASVLRAQLSPEESRLHAELFPDEAALLDAGYDWDAQLVYKAGAPLGRDAFGRILDREAGVLYEWVRVDQEGTWRRYPLARLREAVTARGT